MTIPTGGLVPLLPPAPHPRDRTQLPLPLALPERASPLDGARRTIGGTPAAAPPRGARPTPWLMTRIGIPASDGGEDAGPARAALTVQRHVASPPTELDRLLAGERAPEPRGAMRVLVEPALWFGGAYVDVAQRLAERHPQVWLCLAGSTPPRGRLTIPQRRAVRGFVEGKGTTRLAVLAGDADLQALVHTARLERRLLAALGVLLGVAVLVALAL